VCHLIKIVAQRFGEKVKKVEIEAASETVQKFETLDLLINSRIQLIGPA
jgi:hypothetical protein